MARTARWPRSRRTSRGAMSALGRVDSLSLDPHKWLFAPLDAGCLLVRDAARAAARVLRGRRTTSTSSPIATCPSYAYWDHSPELSRRFRALKIWFMLKIHGARAIQQAIDDNIAAAQHLAQHRRAEQRLRADGAGAAEHRLLPLRRLASVGTMMPSTSG